MKRNIVIATVAAAALIGGGTATALAVTADGGSPTRQSTARAAEDAARVVLVRDDRADSDRDEDSDASDDSVRVTSIEVTASDAIAAALRHAPGTAVSAELDDHKGAVVWDVAVLAVDDTWHSVRVDLSTGRVLGSHVEHEDGTAEVRAALKGASTTAAQAARAAAAKGVVTSVDLEDDGGRAPAWEAETRTSQGVEREWRVDLGTGKVTAVQSDDD
ncbi:PepSY domain-containing protein [Streptomyces sp. NPDC048275]|uniref:PepSY domain-containing protein n=1 Tax=Streptomyces sp. NPDC048275 TaxID=3155629 RepID=UPI0033FA023C